MTCKLIVLFQFLFQIFSHVEKQPNKEAKVNFIEIYFRNFRFVKVLTTWSYFIQSSFKKQKEVWN